ncbi:DUF6084 family protein [Thermopolyspora sp. NPDC052614]|uniref:DUF6084 family protein n=1 Tax=Thermopolyspora sp. NPDC052614 TaxID=3155682 RepID=UPI003431D89E
MSGPGSVAGGTAGQIAGGTADEIGHRDAQRDAEGSPGLPGAARPPVLRFAVEDAAALECAAVPTVRFTVRIDRVGTAPVQCLALNTQIRIVPARRAHDPATRLRLAELFGTGEGCDRPPPGLLWARTSSQVAGFEHGTVTHVDVGCTYDFEVAVAKYFHVLPGGEVPLEFQFSGTVFYLDRGLLRAARVPWDAEATFRMPVRVWREVMNHYFPREAWLRLDQDAFDRLYAYRVRNTLGTWEQVVDSLLAAAGEASRGRTSVRWGSAGTACAGGTGGTGSGERTREGAGEEGD